MDDDYVNKQIVCPNCGARDIIYIDLNSIRDDPRVESGTVTRAFTHLDHLLLLDIDYHGDIRTINQIDKRQEININQEKYHSILDHLGDYNDILLISDDSHLNLLLQEITDGLGINQNYLLNINEEATTLKMQSKQITWVQPDKIEVIDRTVSWQGIFIEVDDLFDLSKISSLCVEADKIVTNRSELLKSLQDIIGENSIELI